MTTSTFPSNRTGHWRIVTPLLVGLICFRTAAGGESPDEKKPATDTKAKPAKVVKLFDGKTLKGWKVMDEIDFDRHGEVKVKNGELILEEGQLMTGISWKGEFPKVDYEVTFEARRIKGNDFFCGMTFPVNKSHCSLILGGWGGYLTGISSIDGFDASENDTTDTMEFKEGQWYKIRLRVTEEKMQAWVGKEQILDFEHKDRELSLRWEMDDMPPFGFATYSTTAGYRNIVLKRL